LLIIIVFRGLGQDIFVKQISLPGEVNPSGINTILPDSTGFIWLATTDGLYRWDGINAKYFSSSEATDNTNITALAEGLQGNIWAATDEGAIYLTKGHQLVLWKEPDTGSFRRINDLMFDAAGNLWWGTNGSGIFFHDREMIRQFTTTDGLPDNYIYNLERGYFGEVWASTDKGIALCKTWEGIHEIKSYEKRDGLDDDIVRVVTKDQQGKMWLGFHEGGLCFYQKEKDVFKKADENKSLEFGQIDAIAVRSESIWVADKQNGLLFSTINGQSGFSKAVMHGEELPQRIRMIEVDPMGNLWILGRDGLFVSSGGAFGRIIRKFDQDLSRATAVISESGDELWLATETSILKAGMESSESYLQGKINETSTITTVTTDQQGNFWIGTFGDGVIVFNPKTGRHRFIKEKDGLINNSVLNISIRDEHVWIATLGGASHLTIDPGKENRFSEINSFNKEDGLGNNFIYCILQDSKNNVWFGTDGNGLIKYDGKTFQAYDELSGLGERVVYSVTEDRDGELWISTASAGLLRFDGTSFHNILNVDEVTNTVYALATSGEFIFILLETGLQIMNKITGNIMVLNEELGLRRINAPLNSAFTDSNIVCFVTEQGILRIDTEKLRAIKTFPLLTIERVSINLETANLEENARLSADENKLIFEHIGFWHLAPAKVHYKTRLTGYDNDWQTTYNRRSVYASLYPGKYNFEVQAMISDFSAVTSGNAVSFTILKPIYARRWFIIIAVFVLAGVIWWLIRFRELRLKEKDSRQKEKLEFEFQTLKNQINPHFLFNSFSTLIYMIEEEPKVAAAYAEKLSDFFRNILEVKDKELIPVIEELTMMDSYHFIQKKRFGNNFALNIRLDRHAMESRIPPLTLQLLAENAIKHNVISKNKPLVVNIYNDGTYISISNKLQPKKQAEASTGLGLKNIIDRYRLIVNKKVRVEKSEDEFNVFLPIIR
jgi:ligand-binding sensor domain-containing protein